ncbi:hypothetical protein B0J12DRAFT_784435 [Macrophomina phaseolina]|uniref:Uncharacterized protein n=1 Tax=Macrophomina phaseolina TaxID=35725 RepID=A0ABQ8GIE4_9PEZI|nr:hypothetical protein B0J12DRAFT_784435 [Macrophomina phaseolina]
MSGNECYSNECGNLAGYTWSNVAVTLTSADKSFGENLVLTKATYSGFITSDDGITWTGDVKIAADHFPTSS